MKAQRYKRNFFLGPSNVEQKDILAGKYEYYKNAVLFVRFSYINPPLLFELFIHWALLPRGKKHNLTTRVVDPFPFYFQGSGFSF